MGHTHDLSKEIALRLKRLRQKRKISQERLAEESQINRLTILEIEKGIKRDPRISTLWAVARALQVSLVELVGEP